MQIPRNEKGQFVKGPRGYVSSGAFKPGHRKGLPPICPFPKEHKYNVGKTPWNKGKTCPAPPTAFKPGHRESAETNKKRRTALIAAHETNQFGFVKGAAPWNKGLPWPEEVKAKVSRSRKGIKAGNHLGHLNGMATRFKKGDIRTHGFGKHSLYPTHQLLMKRCYDPDGWAYKEYGGANPPVTVWEPWHDVRAFILGVEAILGPRPPDMTIDRINAWDGYYPWNVRWATLRKQRLNRRKQSTDYSVQCGDH